MNKHDTLDLATNMDLEAERKFASQSNKTARVKIDRGHAWLIRLLPFPQGPAREPFARLAQHWIGGRSLMCKTNTSPNFGGDPSYDCPICSTVGTCKNEARDDDERDEFYQVEARISYRCYCLVFRKEDDKGRAEEITGDDMLVPHEFNIAKSSFAILSAKIERSKSRQGAPPMGILDLERGCDLWAIRDKKNSLTFDLSEDGPGPIFTLDDLYDEKLARVWKQLRQPVVKFLPDDRLDDIADMISEKSFELASKSLYDRQDGDSGRGTNRGSSRGSYRGSNRGSSRGSFHESQEGEEVPRSRRSSRSQDDTGDQEPAPESRRPASTGRSNSFSRAQAALGDSNDDDQVPGAEVPARRQSQPHEAPPPADQRDNNSPEEAPPVSSARGGATARIAPAGRVSVPPGVAAGRRAGSPPPPPPPPASRSGGRIEDEAPGEGDLPEESSDPSPAEDAEREPVERRAPAPAGRGGIAGALRTSVQNLAARGR